MLVCILCDAPAPSGASVRLGDDRVRGSDLGARTTVPGVTRRVEPSIATIKALFAASPNVCAYTGCDEKLTDPAWKETNAEIAHICGERPGAARFDPLQSERERNGYDNLILLCPKHHKLIDRLDPDSHSAERLREMKAKSELHGSKSRPWATDAELTRWAILLLASIAESVSSGRPESAPRLSVERTGDRVVVTNTGTETAVEISIVDTAAPGRSPVLLGDLPPTLTAGGRFEVGRWARSFGSASFASLTVSWQDKSGHLFIETFSVN